MDKRRKELKKPKVWDKQDRISNLPDVLLTHILSFVCTRDAVSTSVLSKRWKPLWANVPTLHLRDSEFSPYGDALVDRSKRKANFLTFVNRFLMRNNWSPVREFHLRCEECYDFSLIESWMFAVKSPHLEELLLDIYTSLLPGDLHSKNRLHLSLSYKCLDTLLQQDTSLPTGKLQIAGSYLEDPSILDSLISLFKEWNIVNKLEFVGDADFDRDETYNFSQKLFTWDVLVVLKLRNCTGIDCPKDSICFPNLKVLHLENNRFKYDDSASNLISSSCPVLEELEITRIEFDELLYLVITSLTLKFLKLYFWDSNHNLPFETVIDVPALEYLDLRDHLTKKFVLGEFGSVIEATVDVRTQCAAEILGKIHNVQKLMLYENAWGYGGTKTFGLPAFHYLTCLEFCTYDGPCDMEWQLIIEFLSRSPTLEDLSFEGVEFVFGEELDLTSDQDVPHCLLSSLKNCQIYLRSCQVSYIEVIGYILKNAKVLEYMNIHHYLLYVDKQEISALSRESSACEIYFYG